MSRMWKSVPYRGKVIHMVQIKKELNKSYVEICTIQRKSCSYGADEEKLNESCVEICTIQRKSCSYGTDEEKIE